ncbi:MAG: AAA family ATPase [Sulfuricella sp.]|nr:AAA family ATPase [Sulfuricella sp.]
MYLEHFGLREAPFGLTPDTQFFIACGGYQEALNTLLIAVKNGEGFIKITGDVGTGKTILCRKFLASLDKEEFATAYMHNPYLDPRTLLFALAEELEVPIEKGLDQYHLLRALNLGLLNIARQKKRAVLCLDEAQAMPLETLEALRLLTNLETEKRKLLQVVLFGQPELDQRLQQESVRQLKQRITFHFQLLPLNKEEMKYYVTQRLSIAGYRGVPLFSRGALDALYRASGGIPRLVNILAHKTLMLAYGQGKHQVGAGHVRDAVIDTPSVPQRPARRWAWWLAAGLALAAAAVAAWMGTMRA